MIYVASSWRNIYQPSVVTFLRKAGFAVYDFRNPKKNDYGFQWSEIDPEWKTWTTKQYVKALSHPIARKGYATDMRALKYATALVLVLPAGRSAHLEAGFCVGHVPVCVYSPEICEPELMYKMVGLITDDIGKVIRFLKNRYPSVR